jgi:hypothetical protein
MRTGSIISGTQPLTLMAQSSCRAARFLIASKPTRSSMVQTQRGTQFGGTLDYGEWGITPFCFTPGAGG